MAFFLWLFLRFSIHFHWFFSHSLCFFMSVYFGFHQVPEICRFIVVHQIWETFGHYCFRSKFFCHSSCPVPKSFHHMYVKHVILSHRSLATLLLFFSLCFSLDGFCCYDFKLTDLFWGGIKSAIKLAKWVYFVALEVPFGPFKISLLIMFAFPFTFLGTLVIDILRSFTAISIIAVLSLYVSIDGFFFLIMGYILLLLCTSSNFYWILNSMKTCCWISEFYFLPLKHFPCCSDRRLNNSWVA